MEVIIRPAKPEDWETIQKLNNQVFEADKNHDADMKLDWPFTDVGIKYYKDLSSGDYGYCYIAEINGNPVGYIAMHKKDFGYRLSKYLEVENIGVDPEFRSKGIGTKLINKAKEQAKILGIKKLYVAAYFQNTRAVEFYKKSGFAEMGIELDMTI